MEISSLICFEVFLCGFFSTSQIASSNKSFHYFRSSSLTLKVTKSNLNNNSPRQKKNTTLKRGDDGGPSQPPKSSNSEEEEVLNRRLFSKRLSF